MLLAVPVFPKIPGRDASMSNTVERIRPVNGLTRLVRLVQVVKQWFTGCTGRGSMVTCISLVTLHPYESYDPYGSWNNGLRVVQLVKCISLERLTVYIQVHDSYDSWKNGSRVVSGTIGELRVHRYLHTDDKQFCRTHTSREWLERQTC